MQKEPAKEIRINTEPHTAAEHSTEADIQAKPINSCADPVDWMLYPDVEITSMTHVHVHGTHTLGPKMQMGESKGQKDALCILYPIWNSMRKIPLSNNSLLRFQFTKKA